MKLRLALALCALASSAFAQNLPTPNLGSGTKLNGVNLQNAATKATGTSVADPATGMLEALLPVQTVTGANKTFGSADLYKETRRSNGGAAMSDSFPAASTTGLVNGTTIQLNNADTSASITVAAGTGTTVNGNASVVIPPNRSTRWIYDAPNAIWRSTMNSLSGVLGPSSATSGNVATFSGTTGALIQDSGKALPAGAVVGTSDAQALTNKSIDASEVNSGSLADARLPATFPTSKNFTGGFQINGNNVDGGPTSYTPTISCINGPLASVGATITGAFNYKLIDKIVLFSGRVTVTTAGTCNIPIISLPFTTTAGGALTGYNSGTGGGMIAAAFNSGGTTTAIVTYNGGNPAASGALLDLSGWFFR